MGNESQEITWDWKCLLPRDIFYGLQYNNFPGWQKIDGKPHFIRIECIRGHFDSRSIAVALDDVACFQFYYRDWTESNLPFVERGEKYAAGFWLQAESDAAKLRKLCEQIDKQ